MNLHSFSRFVLSGFCIAFLAASSWISGAEDPSVPIASITFEGNRSFTAQQLERVLRVPRVPLEGGISAAGELKSGLHRVETLYRDEGFLSAKVGPADIRMQTVGESKAAVIRIPVTEGARYRVGRLEVKNTRILAPAALIQMCPLRAGEPFSRSKISQWMERIEDTYSSMGHIRARCDAHETVRESDHTVDCSLECTEGKSYRVGKITLIGDESIDRLQFKKRLLLSEGGIFNPESLITSLRYLNNMRVYKPITSSDVEMVVDEERGVVDLVWRLSLPGGGD